MTPFAMRNTSMGLFKLISIFLLLCNGYEGRSYHELESMENQSATNATVKTCYTPECQKMSEELLLNMDESVNPCDDFHEFVCGNFIKRSVIPPSKDQWGPETPAMNAIKDNLRMIFEDRLNANTPKPFNIAKQFYDACMGANMENSLAGIKTIFKQLGGWPVVEGENWKEEDFNWIEFHHQARMLGFKPNFLTNIEVVRDPDNVSAFFVQVSGTDAISPEKQSLKTSYISTVMQAALLGANIVTALDELQQVLEFEEKLVERNHAGGLYRKKIEVIQHAFPFIPWVDYINSGINIPNWRINSNDTILIQEISYYSVLEMINTMPKRTLANYLFAKLLLQPAEDFWLNEPSSSSCLDIVKTGIPLLTNALYAQNILDEDSKNRAAEIVTNVKNSFRYTLETAEWINDEIRQKALEKIDAMKGVIGCKPELEDDKVLEQYYSKLELDSDNYFLSWLKINRFDLDNQNMLLIHPVEQNHWTVRYNILIPNAAYLQTFNQYEVTAGILQGVFFNKDRPRYMNYGSIGYVMGHEITHGFDTTGANYDKNGNPVTWWGEGTEAAFNQKSQCFAEQYSRYFVSELDRYINGNLTLGENIADNGGVRSAYRAYKEEMKNREPEERLPGLEKYTPEQMFWVSTANVRCTKQSKHALQRALNNVHAPPKYRIWGPLVNNRDFARDFKCSAGSKMYSEKPCRLW